MFKLTINNQEFTSDTYESFCKDLYLWDEIQRKSGWQGTGGDWRYIASCLHNAVMEKIKHGYFNEWHGIYKPFSIPPIGFKIEN